MSARSSVASRLLVCLVAVLLVGAGIAGAVAAVAPTSGATALDSDGDSLENGSTESSAPADG
ncbi:hypothetical protein [Natronorubrum sp. DTA28]|uniref:hypothetical protein n=1 Tax=Natronorubrum sp. DTA28 TaxID=3447019 RepID=UPI003F85C419